MARILVVDDERETREALKRALEDEDATWELLDASDEIQGIRILRENFDNEEAIDVVLTDLVMRSESSGMTMLEEARRIDPLIMAILFTAKEKNLDRFAAFEFGAFDVVEKNIRGATAVKEIIVKTRAALRYREWSQRILFLRRYFDPKVFDAIERDVSQLELRSRTVTICFWDIRGFSFLCEVLKAHPTLISGFLREYCEMAAHAVFNHGGVLDKFIGDGVMALFGVLNHKNDEGKLDAEAAVRAAFEFRVGFRSLLATWTNKWKLYTPQHFEINLGCGIHTGEALVGNVGTVFRDQFTALGPHVNFAARIEGAAKNGEILLSQSTATRLENSVTLKQAQTMNDIKNIPGEFRIYEAVK